MLIENIQLNKLNLELRERVDKYRERVKEYEQREKGGEKGKVLPRNSSNFVLVKGVVYEFINCQLLISSLSQPPNPTIIGTPTVT